MRPLHEPDSAPRRVRGRRFRAAIAWLVVLALAVAQGASAASRDGDLDRWVPSFSFYFDVVRQKADGSLTSGLILGPPLNGPPPNNYDTEQDLAFPGTAPSPLQGCLATQGVNGPPTGRTGTLCTTIRREFGKVDVDDADSDTSVVPMVGASLELMTPRLVHGFLDPRLFVRAEGALAFGFERNLAGQGRPGEFSVPPFPAFATDMEEVSIPGQGSRARWQLNRYVYSAGGGVAFTLTLFKRTFRIKPAVEWVQVEQDFIGVTRRALKLRSPSGRTDLSAFREISLNKVKTRSFDGVGAGLELEVDTARLGPVQSSIYASGRAYRLIGTLDTTITAINKFGETATWNFEPERWLFRAGVGFRFRWSPEAD